VLAVQPTVPAQRMKNGFCLFAGQRSAAAGAPKHGRGFTAWYIDRADACFRVSGLPKAKINQPAASHGHEDRSSRQLGSRGTTPERLSKTLFQAFAQCFPAQATFACADSGIYISCAPCTAAKGKARAAIGISGAVQSRRGSAAGALDHPTT